MALLCLSDRSRSRQGQFLVAFPRGSDRRISLEARLQDINAFFVYDREPVDPLRIEIR